jgi:hypothetical protein
VPASVQLGVASKSLSNQRHQFNVARLAIPASAPNFRSPPRFRSLRNVRFGSNCEKLAASICLPLSPRTRTLLDAAGTSQKKKGHLRCHKRPKSREETPKEGSDSGMGLGGRYGITLHKTIAISGSIERRETSWHLKQSRNYTTVYGARS